MNFYNSVTLPLRKAVSKKKKNYNTKTHTLPIVYNNPYFKLYY